ncbi:MAG: hypothetical protein ACI4ED_00970 [Suilimivivens sp.]
MRIGALSFQPYIYNTNYLSQSSLNKVSPIPDDLLSSKTDFSELSNTELYSEDLNENPLQKGETADLAATLQMQFETGQQNATRLIKPVEDNEELVQNKVTTQNPALMQRAIEAYQANMIA